MAVAISVLVGKTLFWDGGLLNGSEGARNSAPSAEENSATSGGRKRIVYLTASRETDPVPHGGDAADDPAIWVHPRTPADSLIIGTDKQGGLAVYDLAGTQLQYLPHGEMNNVDLRTGFPLGGRKVALVTAGNRSNNSIAIYRIDAATRRLVAMAARTIHPGIETYGSCMYRSPDSRRFYYFATSKSGKVEQWELFDNRIGAIDARKVRGVEVGSVTEGCVADDELARFYVSEESRGIWRYGAEPTSGSSRTLVDSTESAGHLVADVEGLTISYESSRRGHLIASSQGNNSFVVYRRAGDNRYLATFKVRAGDRTDALEDSDGIDITTADLGPSFPIGLLVAQDGSNDGGNQNFKLVAWRAPAARPLTDSPVGSHQLPSR